MNFFDEVKNKVNKVAANIFKNKNTFVIKNKTYIEEKLLGEGGFGYVYLVSEESKNNLYALKKINILDNNSLASINKELNIWKKLNNNKNIIKLIDFEINKLSRCALILMEYSCEGNLLSILNNEYIEKDKYIEEKKALEIFKDIVNAICSMHSFSPPIAHRDIKVENVLKINNLYKVCDFGSASEETLYYDSNNNNLKDLIREQFSIYERTTTSMYRPPELVDEYLKFDVNEKVDIWMLGCLLFTLLYKTHPFLDAQKSTIAKAYYHFPVTNIYTEKIDDFIRLMLSRNPKERPSAKDILNNYLYNWDKIQKIDLSKDTLLNKQKQIESNKAYTRKENNYSKDIDISYNPISEDLLNKAKEEILKKQKKKRKYNNYGNDDQDINSVFEDLNHFEDDNNMYNNAREVKNDNKFNDIDEFKNSNNNCNNIINNDFDSIFMNNTTKSNTNNCYDNKKNIQINNNIFEDFDNIFSNNNNNSNKCNNNINNKSDKNKKNNNNNNNIVDEFDHLTISNNAANFLNLNNNSNKKTSNNHDNDLFNFT